MTNNSPKITNMKLPLFILLVCLGLSSSAQDPNSAKVEEFKIETVKFQSEGIILEGSLYIPENIVAALVLVHGSGQETRMTGMAETLARNGIAVLTYDKRGVGKSGGIYAGPEVGTNNVEASNLNILALDASAALNELSRRMSGKDPMLGLMGFSQAAWIIPKCAKINKKVQFITLFSSPIVTTLEQLRFQFYTNGNTKFWETHSEADAREHISNDTDRYQFAPTDPREALSSISIPGLWLYGGKDIQAPVGLSIERLNSLINAGKPYTYRMFPELGHNTSFSKSNEPVNFAVGWVKSLADKSK